MFVLGVTLYFFDFYLTKLNNMCIIKIENEKPQMWLTSYKCLDTSNSGKFTDVSVFYWFLLLLSNTTSAIIEVRAMIVVTVSA